MQFAYSQANFQSKPIPKGQRNKKRKVKPLKILGLARYLQSQQTTMMAVFASSSLPNFKNPHFSLNIIRRQSSSPPPSLINNQPQPQRSRTCCSIALEQQQPFDKTTNIQAQAQPPRDMLPKIDKSGRFCSPRAARELALSIAYAACLEGCDPVRLFDKRINAPREPGYEFHKESLLEYNHMSFGGPPVTVHTLGEADELTRIFDRQSAIEAQVLTAPPKLVYSKLILRFTRNLLVAVTDRWDTHVLVIDKVAPPNWKKEPAGRILELCILHLAMSEITVLGTRHQIVINEAIDLAKRFCDGAAPRIINGCLRTFLKDSSETDQTGRGQLMQDMIESS